MVKYGVGGEVVCVFSLKFPAVLFVSVGKTESFARVRADRGRI